MSSASCLVCTSLCSHLCYAGIAYHKRCVEVSFFVLLPLFPGVCLCARWLCPSSRCYFACRLSFHFAASIWQSCLCVHSCASSRVYAYKHSCVVCCHCVYSCAFSCLNVCVCVHCLLCFCVCVCAPLSSCLFYDLGLRYWCYATALLELEVTPRRGVMRRTFSTPQLVRRLWWPHP